MGQSLIIPRYHCSECGTWHSMDELKQDKMGALICIQTGKRVKSVPSYNRK